MTRLEELRDHFKQKQDSQQGAGQDGAEPQEGEGADS